jgi:hypothetical protein
MRAALVIAGSGQIDGAVPTYLGEEKWMIFRDEERKERVRRGKYIEKYKKR